jgi:hypothetical protein
LFIVFSIPFFGFPVHFSWCFIACMLGFTQCKHTGQCKGNLIPIATIASFRLGKDDSIKELNNNMKPSCGCAIENIASQKAISIHLLPSLLVPTSVTKWPPLHHTMFF